MRTSLLLILLITALSCKQEKQLAMVTQGAVYEKYLETAKPGTDSKHFRLWNDKIKPDSMQLTSLGIAASYYGSYFQNTGDISFLKQSEQALKKAVSIAAVGKAGYERSLARTYISQHNFPEALRLAELAYKRGSGLSQSRNLLFDVHMELGNYELAEEYLDSIKDMSSFDYLIRLSKWNDHLGDLDSAIRFMELATKRAETARNRDLMIWSYTNLADFYGHAGRIADAYAHYLKALKIDPQNAYAKKGIAWIVFSYEKRPEEALRILERVEQNFNSPDIHLLKAEIYEYQNNEYARSKALKVYKELASQPEYGIMYHKSNILFRLYEENDTEGALKLAREEVENRPTPETYSLLAYTEFKRGNLDIALQIADEHVNGKTGEPEVLLQLAEIYKAAGRTAIVSDLRDELLSAIFELGPLSEAKIRQL
ncbi:tetratricopeptide repeat protein [Poritiphilus flavus]|uniref:Tetratricopeptide repeat protein n=1 Tax=Poritiphilus flavus TaxID=2697053 RepID=A0A6L9EA43_9FLAO|nr:tetratricopeptide repeat protein [Poritiphilus flavus]NAS11606.1 tetratricopeptide repeat protein [Poritiphilus flavus]